MSEVKFTKGEWGVIGSRVFCGNLTIAQISRAYDGDYSKANAHLIAAAPAMYEALEHILENQALGSPLALSINNLLAKARGE